MQEQSGSSSLAEEDIVEYKEVRKVHIQAACDEFTTAGPVREVGC